ncbi:MAG: patatin-like phospholipase family protein [Maritimibacter sp.]|nr:patatin-like phospholipase family protein [Maritimibacter sp.]
MARKPKIGVALGSGGARGWCHIGALKGLQRLGVEIDVVAGSSVGAVVGAAFAGGKLDALEAWVLALTQGRFVTLMDLSLRSGGLIKARQVEILLKSLGLPAEIEDFELPFAAIATDMETGREVWLTKGPSYRAVRASAGIPGLMTPVKLGERWLIDGGLVNPVPVSAARALGADVIISVNPNARRHGKIWMAPDPKPAAPWLARLLPEALHDPLGIDPEPAAKEVTPNYFAVVSASLDIMSDTIRRARMAGDPPHIALEAHITDLTVLELYRGAEAIAEGERIVLAQAEAIREVCGLA